MSSLSTKEKMYLEKLFQMSGGYVLDFSDRTMGEFFPTNLDTDIYDDAYNYASGSKANRLRGFWTEADDPLVGRSILELLDYIDSKILLEDFNPQEFNPKLVEACKTIGRRLLGTSAGSVATYGSRANVEAFMREEFRGVNAAVRDLDSDISGIINQRLVEIEAILEVAPLGSIFLIGSTLEGILLDVAKKHGARFVAATSAPTYQGKVTPIDGWKLNDLINVACEVGYVSEDVKTFSHVLRQFRNYIHPRAQATADFKPTADTAKICFQVLKAALTEVNAEVQSDQT